MINRNVMDRVSSLQLCFSPENYWGYNLTLIEVDSFNDIDTNLLGKNPCLIKNRQNKYKIWGNAYPNWKLSDFSYDFHLMCPSVQNTTSILRGSIYLNEDFKYLVRSFSGDIKKGDMIEDIIKSDIFGIIIR